MEQDPPKASDVGREALEELRSNFDLVKKIVFPVIPILFIIEIVNIIVSMRLVDAYGNPEPGYYVFLVAYTLVVAWVSVHYILRWHLFSMLGTVEHKGGWLNPDKKYSHFFYKTILIQVIFLVTVFLSVFLLLASPILGLIVFIPLLLFGIYAACRISFILPATVMGHTPTVSQIWQFAKNMVGKTIWGPIAVTYKYIIGMIVYAFIFGLIIGTTKALSGAEQFSYSVTDHIISFIFINIPFLLGAILFCLVYVGVLSRYYKWGLENRTDAYGDFK